MMFKDAPRPYGGASRGSVKYEMTVEKDTGKILKVSDVDTWNISMDGGVPAVQGVVETSHIYIRDTDRRWTKFKRLK